MPCPQPCWWEQKVLGCRVWATVNGKTVGTGKEFVRWTRRPAGPGYEDTDCSEDSEGDTESDDELVAPDAAPPWQPVAPGRQQPAAAAALQPPATLDAQRQPPAAFAPLPAPSAPPAPAPPTAPARA